MFNNQLQTFYKASIFSLIIAIIIIIINVVIGKQNVFLYLNADLGNVGDFIFNYITYLADGATWAILIIGIFIYKRKYTVISLISLLISTIISQGIKRYIFPTELRPIKAIPDNSLIHVIPNVPIHEVGSFPSGHTTQIFAMYLLLCLIYGTKKMLWVGLLIACLVAYSRIYQAQHFPIDIAGGIIAALISVWVAFALQHKMLMK